MDDREDTGQTPKQPETPQQPDTQPQPFVVQQPERKVPYAFNANAEDTSRSDVVETGATPTAAPRKSKKGLIISLIATALVLLGAGLAYVYWYQNPNKVVSDALMNAITAKTVAYTGTVTTVGTTKLNVTLNGDMNSDGGTLNAKFAFDADDQKYALDGNAVFDAKNDLYVKVQNIDGLVNNYRRAIPADSQMLFDQIIDKIDDKWVKISSEDLKSYDIDLAKTRKCTNDAARKIQDDASTKNELTNAYKKHPFITIEKSLGAKDGSLGYELSSNQEVAKSFAKEYKNSELYKTLVKCDSSLAMKDDDIVKKAEEKTGDKTNVQLWVDRWTHQITKVSVKNDNNKDQTVNVAIEPKFNHPVKITTPKESTTLEQLQQDVMKLIQSAQTSPTDTPEMGV
ncbi:MAG: hypothetical protein JWM07_269 [Candidatus Saccharibacteria bacterium]|nr:hypothetical protein [Candidatus Saccharibacteria bacterium]